MLLTRRSKRILCQCIVLSLICIIFFYTKYIYSPTSFLDTPAPIPPMLNKPILDIPASNKNDSLGGHSNADHLDLHPQIETAAVFPPPVLPSHVPPMEGPQSHNLGSGGDAVKIDKSKLSSRELEEYEAGWKKNSFNQFLSDRISVRRYIPDNRNPGCKKNFNTSGLDKTSVIICFHNEAYTALIRSVHSVIDRSPAELIQEIILVDDASTIDILKKPLDDYLVQLNGLVKMIRLNERSGLIVARMKGAAIAQAPVLTFLDSHIECIPGWLEPLLYAIKENDKTVISPVIGSIKDDTLEIKAVDLKSLQVGGFTWGMTFTWHYPPKKDLLRPGAPYSPIPTPTIAGGLFSIHRNFFRDLGWYDPEFEVWGAENLEISFKTWMCHGRLLISPCSQVGHIFRKKSPYNWKSEHKNPLAWNNARLVETLLGEHKKYYSGSANKRLEFGDVSERKAILKRLGCHSFEWYLDTIYPDKFDPSKAVISGRIRNPATNLCLDAPPKSKKVNLYACHNLGGNQMWYYTVASEIRSSNDDKCCDSNSQVPNLGLYDCHGQKGAQLFSYSKIQRTIQSSGKCLTVLSDMKSLRFENCRTLDSSQNWIWDPDSSFMMQN